MKNERLWVARALVLVVCGAVLMVMGIPGSESEAGPIWGSVRVNGRPLTTGAVVFMPIAERDFPWASARLDHDGSFSVDPKWERPQTGAVPYKIFLVPDRRSKVSERVEHAGGRTPKVVPVSFSLGSPASSDGDDRFGVPRRFRDPDTTNLEVKLDKEAARIDLDLRD
jgi:hypothetical protein